MTIEEAQDLLTNLLCEIPIMQADEDRRSMMDQMRRRGVNLRSPASGNSFIQCLQIIDSAMAQRGALQKLANLLEWADRTPNAHAFANTVEELLPTDLLLLGERMALFAELSPHVPTKNLMLYYMDATSGSYQDSVAEPPEQFADLESLVCELEQIQNGEPGHPVVRMIESIAEQANKKKTVRSARRWSDLLAARIDEDAVGSGSGAEQHYLAERRKTQHKASALQAGGGRATLVLKLEKSGPRPDAYFLLTAWLYSGRKFIKTIYSNDDPIELNTIKVMLIGVLEYAFRAARQLDPDERQVDLEFAVPRSMLCCPFEKWTFTNSPYALLAKKFVVVVRDLERQRGLIRFGFAGWEDKWNYLTRNGNAGQDGIIKWITCDGDAAAPGDLYNQLDEDNVSVLGLTFPPRDSPHHFDLAEALDTGTPIAIWPHWCKDMKIDPRDGMSINFAFQEELSRRLDGRPITDLPRIAMEMRRGFSGAARPLIGLTLLWDDPWRWPEPRDFNLGVPVPLSQGETT